MIGLSFLFIILSGTLNVMYFSVFSPKQSIFLLNFSANSLIINPHMHKFGPRGPTLYIFGD